jgi:hypothetical protein
MIYDVFLFIFRTFTGFGGPVPHRPAEDFGGSFINYYMVTSILVDFSVLMCGFSPFF